jgi:TRAP-type C4-dicarboxylate transport system substrate-binding protein
MRRGELIRGAFAAVFGLGFAFGAGAQEITLKVHHFWPPGAMPPKQIVQPWCDKIAAESNQRLKCQIFPAMQLGGTPPQLFDQAKDGVADIVFTLPGYTAGRFPIMEVFELPFMTPNAEAASKAAWDFYVKYAQQEFAAVKPLWFNTHDNGYVHTRERQVKTLADLKGLKLRAPTRQTNRMLAAFGAAPVGMPVPQVADALSKGTIDGYVLPWEVIPAFKLHELTKYESETDPGRPALYTATFIFAMNKAKYESLPADLKAVIDRNSGLEASANAGRIWDASAPPARKQAVDRGNVFYTIPASELDHWMRAAQPLYDDWVKEMNAKGLNGKQMLDDARALIAKYAKK